MRWGREWFSWKQRRFLCLVTHLSAWCGLITRPESSYWIPLSRPRAFRATCPLSPGGASSKEPIANAGDIRDAGTIPESGRSPGEEHGNPLQYSYLENPTDRGAW